MTLLLALAAFLMAGAALAVACRRRSSHASEVRSEERSENIRNTTRAALHLGLTDAKCKGDGYEALILRNGDALGRVYLGTVAEFEDSSREADTC